jgi:uncharacterized protein (TIGR00730 family)
MRVCVFCGSAAGGRPSYAEAAREFGRELARRGVGLVYGGSSLGMMGELANAVLSAGGEVHGVIPNFMLPREIAHPRLSELHVTDSMHARKAQMANLADAFVALPGGFGTIDELAEIFTWRQLDLHHKPIGMLNVDGYFDGFVGFCDHAMREGFVKPEHRALLHVASNPASLLATLLDAAPITS